MPQRVGSTPEQGSFSPPAPPPLPPFQLSHGVDRHSKVAGDAFMVAPRGKRVLVHYGRVGSQDSCSIWELDRHGRASRGCIHLACFSHRLAAGTLLVGTQVCPETTVLVEEVVQWLGQPVGDSTQRAQFGMLDTLFNRLTKRPPSTSFLDIALPVWCANEAEALGRLQEAVYPTRGVLAYAVNRRGHRPVGVPQARKTVTGGASTRAVLVGTAELAADAYRLSALGDEGTLVDIGPASVPDIKTSVFMNSMFRSIRENGNLDLLEESEDEEEFELVDADRFVALGRRVLLECTYDSRRGRWLPCNPAPIGSQVSRSSALVAFSTPSTYAPKQAKRRTNPSLSRPGGPGRVH